MNEMDDATLSREVALACGWTAPPEHVGEQWTERDMWRTPTGGRGGSLMSGIGLPLAGRPPDFARSLDACFGPGGPVEYAKAKGIEFEAKYWGALVAIAQERHGLPVTPLRYDSRDHCLAFRAAVKTGVGNG